MSRQETIKTYLHAACAPETPEAKFFIQEGAFWLETEKGEHFIDHTEFKEVAFFNALLQCDETTRANLLDIHSLTITIDSRGCYTVSSHPRLRGGGACTSAPAKSGAGHDIATLQVQLASRLASNRSRAAEELARLSAISDIGNEKKILLLETPGLIILLVRLLRDTHAEVRRSITLILMNLATVNYCKIPLGRTRGLLAGLVHLFQDVDVEVRRNASRCLRSLALYYTKVVEVNFVLERKIHDENRALISCTPGAVGGLIRLLADVDARVQDNAARTLGHLACNSREYNALAGYREQILAGMIPLIHHPDLETKKSVVIALGFVAVEDVQASTAIGKEAALITQVVRFLHEPNQDMKRVSAGFISALTKNISNLVLIGGERGAIQGLVLLMGSDDKEARESAVEGLANLAANRDLQFVIRSEGDALTYLVRLLEDGDKTIRGHAVCTLERIANSVEDKVCIGRAGAVPGLVKLIGESDEKQLIAIDVLEKLTMVPENQIILGQLTDVIPALHRLLIMRYDEKIHTAAAIVLRNLFQHDTNKKRLREHPLFVSTLFSILKIGQDLVFYESRDDAGLKIFAVEVLLELPEERVSAVKLSDLYCIDGLIKLARHTNQALSRATLSCLLRLTKDNIDNQTVLSREPELITSLVEIVNRHSELEVRQNACWVLHYIVRSNRNNEDIAKMSGGVVIASCISWLKDGNTIIASRGAIILANLAGKEKNKSLIRVAPGRALTSLVESLASEDAQLRVNALSALLNMTRGYADAQKEVGRISAAIPTLLRLLRDSHVEIKKRAVGILEALANTPDNQISISRHSEAIPSLLQLLSEGDAIVKQYAVGALQNLAKRAENLELFSREAGFIQVLLRLKGDSNAETKKSVAGLLESLFDHFLKLAKKHEASHRYPLAVDAYIEATVIKNVVCAETSALYISKARAVLALFEGLSIGKVTTVECKLAEDSHRQLEQCLSLDRRKDAQITPLLAECTSYIKRFRLELDQRAAQVAIAERAAAKERAWHEALRNLKTRWTSASESSEVLLERYNQLIAEKPTAMEGYLERGAFCWAMSSKVADVEQRKALLQKSKADFERLLRDSPTNREVISLLQQTDQDLRSIMGASSGPAVSRGAERPPAATLTGALSDAQRKRLEEIKATMASKKEAERDGLAYGRR